MTDLSPNGFLARLFSRRRAGATPPAMLLMLAFGIAASTPAQEKVQSSRKPTPTAKQARAPQNDQPEIDAQAERKLTTAGPAHEDADRLKRREEWFYKQRAYPNPGLPPGARNAAYQHMMRMMEAEGKVVRQPNGSFAAVAPQVGPVIGGAWSSIGPTPTTGGFFSPVSGRVTTIAVDPSDSSGNTVLIGGAQGGIWRSTDAGATWTAVGDANPSLAMGSIAFAPSNPTTVYAGTGEQAFVGFDIYYGAGVLKSTDGGLHWTQTCTTPSTSCPFLAPYGDTINFGFFNEGGARISYLAVHPTNSSLILAGVQIFTASQTSDGRAPGVWCSQDAGATWTNILAGNMSTFVGFAPNGTAYAALGRASGGAGGFAGAKLNGIYKSSGATNACSTLGFTAVTGTGLPAQTSLGRIDLGIAPSDATGNTLYASIGNAADASNTNLGVFVTTNGGTSWTKTAAPDICQAQCWYDDVVKVDPNNKDIVFLGGSSAQSSTSFEWVVRSTNGTTSGAFSPVIPNSVNGGDPTLPHVDQHAMTLVKATSGQFAGKVRMYLGNDGGVWRTDDAEATTVAWTNLNQSTTQASSLTLTQFYPGLSVSPSNPNIIFAGTQDNGSQLYAGGISWTDNNVCGDGGETAIDPSVPTTVFVACITTDLNVSTTGGGAGSFVTANSGINPNDNVNFIAPLAADPSTPGRVYFGSDRVYQSSNSGNSFIAVSGPLPTRAGAALTALGVSPKNPAAVYAGADDGEVFVSTSVAAGTATFAAVAGQSLLPPRNVTAIAVDPADATGNTAYAVFSGFAFGTDTKGHIFKTTDTGATWIDVSCTVASCITPAATDLPNIPANDLVVDPDVPGTIYAATDLGALQGTCTGSVCTWNTLGTALPNVAVLSLRLHEPSRTLIAATHGRGAWSLVLNNFTFAGPHISSISPTSATAPASSNLTLTVNGSGLTGATVQWKANGTTTSLATTVVSDSQLTATVPSTLLSSGGTAQVSATVGAATSNSLTFSVLGAAPTLTSISPTSTPVQTPTPSTNVPIQLTGTNFISSSKVQWNGATNGITTTFNSSTSLTATLPAALLGPFGSTNDITVLNPPPGGGSSAAQTFTVVAPPPANDNFANAISVTTNSFSDTKDSSGATTETADPNPAAVGILPCVQGSSTNGRSNTIWYKFTPSSSGTLEADTIGSNYDTVLSIWTGSGSTEASLTATAVACNDDINPGVIIVSQVQNVSVTANTTYFIMVSSFGAPDSNPVAFGGKSVFNLTFTPPPFTLTPQPPTSVTVTAGSPATYTVAVAPNNGFTGTVNLSCTLPAAATTCTVNPSSVTLGAGQNVTVTVTSTKRGALPPMNLPVRGKRLGRTAPIPFVTILALLLAALAARTRRQRLVFALPLVALILVLVLQVTGCGGGGGGGGGGGTPAGTYTITITGTSGTSSTNTTVTLVVN